MAGLIGALGAGVLAGLVLGFVGAGGTVVGLPILLFAAAMTEHQALGTNAGGVAVSAAFLAVFALVRGRARGRDGLVFAAPGLAGNWLGARTGLAYPGGHLIFLLGFLLFVISGWMFWLSFLEKPRYSGLQADSLGRRSVRLIPLGFAVGWISGFFAIGGGFLIVPALMFAGRLPLTSAGPTALIPICLFAALVAVQYAAGGRVEFALAGIMALAGCITGAIGAIFVDRTPRKWLQRIFAFLLIAIGFYFILR